jgi:hypothetical protein
MHGGARDEARQRLEMVLMIGNKENVILAVGIVLVVLASFHFEANGLTWCSTYDGAHTGSGVLAVIGIVLLFKLTSLWAGILAARGRIPKKPNFPFDWLILAAILTNVIGYRASGEWITGIEDKRVPAWLFDYGQCELKGEFILSVIAIALLLRVYAITKALHAACSDEERRNKIE